MILATTTQISFFVCTLNCHVMVEICFLSSHSSCRRFGLGCNYFKAEGTSETYKTKKNIQYAHKININALIFINKVSNNWVFFKYKSLNIFLLLSLL